MEASPPNHPPVATPDTNACARCGLAWNHPAHTDAGQSDTVLDRVFGRDAAAAFREGGVPAMDAVLAPEPMLQFFSYAHLPPAMQAVSKPFCDLAQSIASTLPRNPERTVALRKLLEAKDCVVRATIWKNS